ncbi:MAG: hypothetical protein BHW44_11600 [Roseburia sp. 40_7]|nr:MAG: hypothetical protein BHW44_11600 [Roseburia sp. 40_7]
MIRLMMAQASAVPIPAPRTPKRGISNELKRISSTHMTAFKILGVTISPLHCKNADVREFNCENGIISEYTKKYAVASGQIAGSPPSTIGNG